LPPQNVTAINTTINGFGSFVFTMREFATYFIEIQLDVNTTDVPLQNQVDFKRDNVTMNGLHIFANGTVRIPLVVEGF
jgi:hypothetical protein